MGATVGTARCPRCKRQYAEGVRSCAFDGATLVVYAGPDATTMDDTSPEPAEAVEEHLGSYRLIHLLGEGGMARVYLAEHEKLGRLCAIKRLHSSHFEDHITVSRFLAEARAVSGIRHPNLVGIYDVIEEPSEICLVMEYLEGQDLGHILRQYGPFNPERAAMLCAQACDGLDAVHSQGIVHRDLKPDNLFLAREPDGQERVKLLDFGVARLDEDRPSGLRTRSGQTVGTPQYMSPEQATASEIDGRSDIYMMGVVLFELVTGRTPFVGKGYGEVMMMHVHNRPQRPSQVRPGIPGWLDDVILRCLEKRPERRFQTARELAAELRREHTARVVLPVEALAVRGSWSHRTWLIVLGVTLALGAGLATWLMVRMPPPRLGQSAQADLAGAQQPGGEGLAANIGLGEQAALPARILVVTEPEGAAVQVNRQLRCLGPCTVDLPASSLEPVEIRVSAPHYHDERRLIDVGSPPPELHIQLRPKATPVTP